MKINVLFISDSSLANPVVYSQGLPLLKFLTSNNYNCFMIHFESVNSEESNEEKLNDVKKLYKDFINFQRIIIKKYPFLPVSLVTVVRTVKFIVSLSVKYKFIVFHARSFYPALICLVIKYILPKTKFIYDNRGLFIEEGIFNGRWKEGGLLVKFLIKVECLIVKKADHIVVVSKAFKKYMLKNFIAGGTQLDKKITVIDNKTIIYPEISSETINKRKKNKDIVAVFAGSAAGWQNVFEIKSFAKVCSQYIPNFKLKIVSYQLNDFIKEIKNDSSLYNITDFIQVKSSEVFKYLLNANFGILLRDNILINNVASPLKFAEYLSAGLPVMLREGIGDTEQIIKKYNVGVIIKENDYESAISELQELLNDKDVYRRCLKIADKEFNINISFKQYQEIYDKL